MATLLIEAPFGRARPPSEGDTVGGRYQILEEIGRGGYGLIFRARHLGTGHDIALKVLIPQPGADDDFAVKRFFLEARSTSGLAHPNTIRVFDFGQEDSGVVYLAMELLRGRTLREELRARRKQVRPFSQEDAVEVAIAICRSLGEAHERGLVHRDLKPDNVFLHRVANDDEPIVKVLDFGIAKLGDSQNTLSTTTSVPGTPAYMSPEHALNQEVDGRADLYSLGVILYQLVTLELPFQAASDPQTLYQHAFAPPPDVREFAKVPITDAFANTVLRLLAKQPSARFADARSVRQALTGRSPASLPPTPIITEPQASAAAMATPAAVDTGFIRAIEPERQSRDRWLFAVGGIILLASLAALTTAIWPAESPTMEASPEAPAAIVPPPSLPPAAVSPPTQADQAEATKPAAPPTRKAQPARRSAKKKASRRRTRRRKTRKALPTPKPPPDKAKDDLLQLRIEDLEKDSK